MIPRSAYSKRPAKRGQISFKGVKTLTKQSFKDECNINNILARYIKTGVITHVNNMVPQYGDSPSLDLLEAYQIVEQAQNSFMALPAVIRAKFDHDPAKFLEFVEDPQNAHLFAEYGLTNAPEGEPAPTPENSRKSASRAPDEDPRSGSPNEATPDGG